MPSTPSAGFSIFKAPMFSLPQPFGANDNFNLFTGNNLGVDDCRSIITGIFTIKYRVAYRGFTQIAFSVALCYACMNGSISFSYIVVKDWPDWMIWLRS